MAEKSFITIRNGVIAGTIASVVAALLIPFIRELVITGAMQAWSLLGKSWALLTGWYALPGWVWGVSGLLSLVGLLAIATEFLGKSAEPDFIRYTEDIIRGVRWRWRWKSNTISDLWGYCIRCDATLIYRVHDKYRNDEVVMCTSFICENCGNTVVSTIDGGGRSYAIGVIEREITRRIRRGEYMAET